MSLRVVAALAVVATALAGPAVAGAAPTAVFANGILTVTGDATGETFHVVAVNQGNSWSVTANQPLPDPDGGGGGCLLDGAATTLFCPFPLAMVVVHAGDGADTITVDDDRRDPPAGAVSIDGQGGNDTVKGGTAPLTRNTIGGAGDDTLIGSDQGADRFVHEPGADTYIGGTHTPSAGESSTSDPAQVQTTLARDVYDATEAGAVNVSLDGVANDGEAQEHDAVGPDVEAVLGSPQADVITAGPNALYVLGGEGDDVVNGSPEDDALIGGPGSDTLLGNDGADDMSDGDFAVLAPGGGPGPAPGADHLDGGAGPDSLAVDAGADDVIGGPGVDTFYSARFDLQASTAPGAGSLPVFAPMTVSLDDLANDGVTGTNEGDNVHSDIENIDSTVLRVPTGLAISVALPVRSDDTITGSSAANRIDTGPGNDRVDGGAGPDTISTGSGDDAVNVLDQETDSVDCGQGTDSVSADLPGLNPIRADAIAACETVTGTDLPGLTVIVAAPPQSQSQPQPQPAKAAVLKLSGATTFKTKAFLKSFALTVGVACDQRCKADGEVVSTGAKIAAVGALAIGSGRLKDGTGVRTLKLSVARSYRSALKRKLRTAKQRKKGIKLVLRVTATNATGQVSTASRAVTIKG